ncbi:ABC transporter permease [Fusobacterium pseudoperiodonticum]|uniref:ABC transporter permease n=1 Tax=Fusobacterium pseudoperiodonticum TaxID=2663009 RepID=A0A2D3PSP2_9FUSO|nr:ABC transporter permease [Fusobacterium pseudoperiodonticum]ATV70657.1 ABC transporter permease [Fusobacterium pseudoperiodonticum]
MELLNEDEEYISSLLKQGKKVEAIAFIKNKTGVTLKEAKDYIDKKNIPISKEDEQYLSSLINENKELEAVVFLHKSKDMSLEEAKNYTDRLILKKNIETNKKRSRKFGYVYDEELNTFVPNLARQKKVLKIMLNIFLVLLVITLIQFLFLDRSSDIKMIIFRFSISGILVLIITLPLGSLSIHYIENKLKKLKNLEFSNQFEVNAFVSNFHLSLHVLLILIFIIIIPIFLLKIDYKDYKGIFYFFVLIAITVAGIYELLKMLKYKKYSLKIDSKEITLLYNKNEIKSIKFEKINFIKFYAKKFKGGENNIPTIEIFDMEKNIFTELDIKISDYILLKMYFEKYKVLVKDEFKKI